MVRSRRPGTGLRQLTEERDARHPGQVVLGCLDGYTGGECHCPIVELQLAGGDFISDVSLLRVEATQRLRSSVALPSHTTL